VHALFGLVTLTLLVFLTQIGAAMLLQGFADNSERAASFLAGLVLSPVLFIGAALLYVDQAARVGTTRADRLALRVAPHDSAQ
jgi:Zn-dependent protease with chaperone function